MHASFEQDVQLVTQIGLRITDQTISLNYRAPITATLLIENNFTITIRD